MLALIGTAYGQDSAPDPSLQSLKQLSMDELTDFQVTSVSRHPEKLLDAASAIQVITNEDINSFGALTLPDALRLADNLDVAQKNSHDWGVSARGFNTDLANKLLVMIDGRTIYTPLYSGVSWNVQDYLLEDIDRIEVISGPGGTLWGANAVNGVINITSKSAKDTQGLYLESGAGTDLPGFAAMRYGLTLAPNVYLRVYAKYLNEGDEALPSGASANDAWGRSQGGFRLDAEPSSQNTFTLQGDAYHGWDGEVAGGEDRNSGDNVLGRWVHVFSDDSDMHLQVYYDHTSITEPEPPLVLSNRVYAPAGIFTDSLVTYDVDFQHRFPIGRYQHIVWGLGYRYTDDEVGNAPSVAFLPPSLKQSLYSAFAQDEIEFTKTWMFTLGTKAEHNAYTGPEWEPSARLQWKATANQTLWTAVSRAVRTPSRIDRDLSEGPPPYLVLLRGDENFTSESVLAYELGYRAQLNPQAAVSLSTYYNDYNDVRSTSYTPATILPFYFANNLEGDTYGFELTGDYQVTERWRLHLGYQLIREHLRVKPGQYDLNAALNETADPEQQYSLRSSLDLPQNLELNTMLRWVDTRPINDGAVLGTVPSYYELDARLAWHPVRRLELAVVGQNLLHAEHPEYGFPNPAQVQIQREVYGKISWHY